MHTFQAVFFCCLKKICHPLTPFVTLCHPLACVVNLCHAVNRAMICSRKRTQNTHKALRPELEHSSERRKGFLSCAETITRPATQHRQDQQHSTTTAAEEEKEEEEKRKGKEDTRKEQEEGKCGNGNGNTEEEKQESTEYGNGKTITHLIFIAASNSPPSPSYTLSTFYRSYKRVLKCVPNIRKSQVRPCFLAYII